VLDTLKQSQSIAKSKVEPEELRAGDIIIYWRPIGIAGRVISQILKIQPTIRKANGEILKKNCPLTLYSYDGPKLDLETRVLRATLKYVDNKCVGITTRNRGCRIKHYNLFESEICHPTIGEVLLSDLLRKRMQEVYQQEQNEEKERKDDIPMKTSPGSLLLSPQPMTVSFKEQGLHNIKRRQSDNVKDDDVKKNRVTVSIQPEYENLSGAESMNIEVLPVSVSIQPEYENLSGTESIKIIWARKGVRNAHNKNALNIGQAGSRPNMKAIDVVINKEMKYLYARLTRTALGTIDNDAKSCFDRIICNLAMMVSLYYGIPLNFCQLQANTLKNTIFRLRTALGDSAQTYRHTIENPIHGTGQGSCSSPALWLLISSLLMDLLERKSKGMTMIDVNNKFEIKKWIEGFVDDTSIFTNIDFISQCAQTLVQHLQEDGCEWAGLLEASGGKLELTKCFYYMLTWTWNDKGEPIPQTIQQQNVQNKVTLSNLSGDPVTIQQKEVEQSHKTLGTYKCIDGNETEQIIQLNKKSTNMGNLVFSGQLNRRQARLAHNMVYIPSMLYSLPAMSIQEEETYSIQQKANTKFLQVCGLAKSFPRAVVYGPTKFGGIGLRYLYTESSCIKIDCLINHIKTDTSLSIEMKININWVQLHAGTSTPILESTQQLLYIEYNWFLSIKEFLNMINAKIEITNLWQPTPLREGDIILMDEVEKLDISIAKKRSFNCWRLFFRINNLSEMTNSQGTHIQKKILNKYNLDNYIPSSLLNWPNQPHPHHKYFNNWLHILRALFRIDKNGKLHKPLGKWITGSKIQIPNNVNFLLHKNNQIIGVRDEKSHLWSFFNKTNELRSTLYFDNMDDLEMPPIDPNEYDQIDAEETNDYYKINKRSIKPITNKQSPGHNNINPSHIQDHI
jgi:hypothetical protein